MPTGINYPASLDTTSQLPDVGPSEQENMPVGPGGLYHDEIVTNQSRATLALETKLGIDSSTDHASVDWKLTDARSRLGTVETLAAATDAALAGKADLVAGKVPSAQLPSYVDDVLEYANYAALPAVGETGKIYVTLSDNAEYRWSGSVYVQLVASPGTTDAVPEGTTNLYFTAARVLAVVLTGLSTATNAVISTTDSVLGALGKLQAQISALVTSVAGKLSASNNLSDLVSASTARTNLGLGTLSTQSATITDYAPLVSPALTGNPTAPTPSPGDNDTSIATTAFVTAAVAAGGGGGGVSNGLDKDRPAGTTVGLYQATDSGLIYFSDGTNVTVGGVPEKSAFGPFSDTVYFQSAGSGAAIAPTFTSPCTVVFAFNRSATPGFEEVMLLYGSGAITDGYFISMSTANKLRFYMVGFGYTDFVQSALATGPHAVAIKNNGGTLTMVVDGTVLTAIAGVGTYTAPSSTARVLIGKYGAAGNSAPSSTISYVQGYGSALSNADMQELTASPGDYFPGAITTAPNYGWSTKLPWIGTPGSAVQQRAWGSATTAGKSNIIIPSAAPPLVLY